MVKSHGVEQAMASLVTLLRLTVVPMSAPVSTAKPTNPCDIGTTMLPTTLPPVAHGNCAGFTCPLGMAPRPQAASIHCSQVVCTPSDTETCCEPGSIAQCDGFEEEYGLCMGLPACEVCTPVDCQFGEWSDWHVEGLCSGLCIRNRTVARPSNKCGAACSGALTATKNCPTHCKPFDVDCMLGDWQAWSVCTGDPVQQRSRVREVKQAPHGRGLGCSGNLEETTPCQEPPEASDCLLSMWDSWSLCSVTCGGGSSTRQRRVISDAVNGGLLCQGRLKETHVCHTQSCSATMDCLFAQWSSWSSCSKMDDPCDFTKVTARYQQRHRKRGLERPASGGGVPCQGPVEETAPCNSSIFWVDPCPVSDWHEWHPCSKSCGGGERTRARHLLKPHGRHRCPLTVLTEVSACATFECGRGNDPCDPFAQDCRLGAWTPWSQCSSKCGIGSMFRNRSIAQKEQNGGKGCEGIMREVGGCEAGETTECLPQDCVWDDWEDWSACTVTCGGGEHKRHRTIQVSPTNGGKLCDVRAKSEVAMCNMQECKKDECLDGAWEQWSDWSECSATCDSGKRSRHRHIAQQANTRCGRPAAGLDEEIETCKGHPCVEKVDCSFTDWDDWSFCGPECFGNRHRYREIARFARGGGKLCKGVVKEMTPCNPAPGEPIPSTCLHKHKFDCKFSDWDQWTECSATCGRGQRQRTRHIVQPPTSKGIPCNGSLMYSEACEVQLCPAKKCVDCRWGLWSDWSACVHACGGQRFRRRSILSLPNFCGKPCVARNAEETMNCTGDCKAQDFYCSWSQWSPFSSCPDTGCGPHTQRRMRSLRVTSGRPGTFVAKGSESMACSGVQSTQRECLPIRPCVDETPVPCEFDDWTEWSSPTCDGLCDRKRVVKQNSHGGAPPCKGPLVESKQCEKVCERPQDCELSPWNAWTQCTDSHSQMYRTRSILTFPRNGGKTCPGKEAMKETDNCVPGTRKQDCVLTEWSAWTSCSQTCGHGGWQIRKRHIKVPGTGGGKMCSGDLEEVQECSAPPCQDTDWCKLGAWEDWSSCRQHQRFRRRELQTPSMAKGCNTALGEVAPCEAHACEIAAWSDWDTCDHTCGLGHQQRYREVLRPADGGGTPCPSSLKQIKGCNKGSCSPCQPDNFGNCMLTAWTDWGLCDSKCGVGQQIRFRNVSQLRFPAGLGCFDPMVETRGCHSPPCHPVDCKWDSWSVWSSCSRTCGGGSKTRTRQIGTQAMEGGKPCQPSPEEEVRPCNEKSCETCIAIDGKWSDWFAWGSCSTSCAGGLSWRTRTAAIVPNSCGKPLMGSDREYRNCKSTVPCDADLDCLLSQWSLWSACSATCSGTTRRSRQIVRMGRGQGKPCEGALQEEESCNPAPGEVAPFGCEGLPKVDCEYGEWSRNTCSVTCGGGSIWSRRSIKVAAQGGGKSCTGAMARASACSLEACPGTEVISCTWSDWYDWGECDQSRGQRKRFRHIAKMPENGGSCDPGASEETQGCTERQRGRYCTWDRWSEWESCSATCGSGVRSRRRYLMSSDTPDLPLPPNGETIPTSILELRPYSYLCREHHVGAGNALEAFTHLDQLSCAVKCSGLEGCTAFDFVRPDDNPPRDACRLFANATYLGDANSKRVHCALRASEDIISKYSSLYMQASQDDGRRPLELLLAFLGGACSLVAVFCLLTHRMSSRARTGSERAVPASPCSEEVIELLQLSQRSDAPLSGQLLGH